MLSELVPGLARRRFFVRPLGQSIRWLLVGNLGMAWSVRMVRNLAGRLAADDLVDDLAHTTAGRLAAAGMAENLVDGVAAGSTAEELAKELAAVASWPVLV